MNPTALFIQDYLRGQGLDIAVVEFAESTKTAREAAEVMGCRVEQIAKSIIFRGAQSGRGMTWSDKSADPNVNGGNCYNCHQLSKQEISYGTIGPSLYHYGRLRGVTDPSSAAARPIVEYTWGKLWNTRAFAACSNMPRFGHQGLLNEQQLKDLMALLLDPKSPINQ